MEGLDAETRDEALAKGLDVVAVGLALDDRAFAEPAARRHAREGDGHAKRAVVAHLQQAVEHPEPERRRPAHAAQDLARRDAHDLEVGDRGAAFLHIEAAQPGDAVELCGSERSRTLEEGTRHGRGRRSRADPRRGGNRHARERPEGRYP